MFPVLTASPTLLWRCSPAASRRISSVSLLKVPATSDQSDCSDSSSGPPRAPFRDRLRSSVERDIEMSLGGSGLSLGAALGPDLAAAGPEAPHSEAQTAADAAGHVKRLPIINPLVRLPTWPSKLRPQQTKVQWNLGYTSKSGLKSLDVELRGTYK